MSTLKIEGKDFEKYKNQLKKFSNNIPKSVNLPTSKTSSGIFGLFSHKVTGEQLNEVTKKIQNHLLVTNNQIIKIIKEFNEIYNTFDKLDKEYIAKIVTSIKAVEIVSEQAIKNSNDIKKSIEVQKHTINKLKEFKDGFEALHQVGDKWDYVQNLKEQVNSIQENFNKNVGVLERSLENQKNNILSKLDISISEIDSKIKVLENNQSNQIQKLKSDIKLTNDNFNKEAIVFNEKINLQERLSNKHRKELLELVEELSINTTNSIKNLQELQREQSLNFDQEVDLINISISDLGNVITQHKKDFKKKIIYIIFALVFVGGLTITHFVLSLFKII